ncbi:MAG: universal stress protein, partial [Bacteroidota bacterium]
SKAPETEILVMGTTGKGGVLEKLFGSISSMVSQKAHCPVWLVPPQVEFKGLQNLLYASNYQSADSDLMRHIVEFADEFTANIHMVHVEESPWVGEYQLNEVLIEQLFRQKAPALEFKMSVIRGSSVWESLYQYAEDHHIDLIVLATRHRKFWENLLHTSITKSMVLNARTPLLVYHLDQ